jgi:hypothetical protein
MHNTQTHVHALAIHAQTHVQTHSRTYTHLYAICIYMYSINVYNLNSMRVYMIVVYDLRFRFGLVGCLVFGVQGFRFRVYVLGLRV